MKHLRTAAPVAPVASLLSPNGRPNRARTDSPEAIAKGDGIGWGALVCYSMMKEHPAGSPEWKVLKEARDHLLQDASPDWVRGIVGAEALACRAKAGAA